MKKLNNKIILVTLFFFNLFVILFFWLKGSGGLFALGAAASITAFGRLFGLLAVYAVLVQFFLMGRNPGIESAFGLDKLSRAHSVSGKFAIGFILLHPILLAWGYGMVSGFGFVKQFIFFLTDYDDVASAGIATLLFLVIVASSLYIVSKRLKYESWYAVHLSVYLAIFYSIGHQFELGEDIISNNLFYGYWVALYVAVLGSHFVFRFLKPVYNFYNHRFYVDRIVKETETTTSVYIKGKNLQNFKVSSGQFMIFRFLSKGMWWQAHPFSLSKPSDGQELRITVKQLGDFTKEVPRIRSGTHVVIDGPYGIFTDDFSRKNKTLLIAGGIGITPIRSLFEQNLKIGKDAVLLYGNRNKNEITFNQELENLSGSKARIVHILSDDPSFEGEKGRIDQEKIARLVPDIKDRDVYICGPVLMMNAIVKSLKSLGLKRNQIHFEKFSL